MKRQPNVVFVVADTLRRDRLSCYGHERSVTPNIDAFADRATVYTDAVAQAPWSIPSHASMFTGKYPREHGATTVAPVLRGEETLAEVLSSNGYRTCAVSSNEYVRPMTGFGRGFDEFHPSRVPVPDRMVDVLGRGVNAVCGSPRLRRPVEAAFNVSRRSSADEGTATRTPLEPAEAFVRDAPEPFFLFVNLIDVHLPRSPDERFRRRFVDGGLEDVTVPTDERMHNFGEGDMNPRQRRKLSQLYDADVATMDARFGRFLETLEAEGVLEDALVVLVSDHGEHLGEFGLVGHQHSVFDSVTSVPLAVKYPGQGSARTVDEQVETRRLFHTALDVAGVRDCAEESLERVERSVPSYGEFYTPMLDLPRLQRDHRAVYDPDLLGRTLSFVRDGGYKLIRNIGEETLYETPERPTNELDPDAYRTIYDQLSASFPDVREASVPGRSPPASGRRANGGPAGGEYL